MRVCVYSLGVEQSSFDSSGVRPAIRLLSGTIDGLSRALPNDYVDVYEPFSSNQSPSIVTNVIVLLVPGPAAFSRRDFFTVSSMLALNVSGSAILLPVMLDSAPHQASEPASDNSWSKRNLLLWQRLDTIAAARLAGTVSSAEEIVSRLLPRIVAAPPNRPASVKRPPGLFLSYSHLDEQPRDQLARHLRSFERMGMIELWHDRKIPPGDEWAVEIDHHLYTSDVILLLLSSDFFASDFCSEIEMPVALERHNARAARVIPIVLRPVVWSHTPLAALQALPAEAKPISSYQTPDSAFTEICEGILRTLIPATVDPEESGSIAPERTQPASSTRKRILDAAMPAHIEVNRSEMLVVLLRKPSSAGLRGLLAEDKDYGVQPEDVRSKTASIEFPAGKAHKFESVRLMVSVYAPDLTLSYGARPLVITPDADSQPLIFMVTAKREGVLHALVQVHDGEELVVSCALTTLASASVVAAAPGARISSSEFAVLTDFAVLEHLTSTAKEEAAARRITFGSSGPGSRHIDLDKSNARDQHIDLDECRAPAFAPPGSPPPSQYSIGGNASRGPVTSPPNRGPVSSAPLEGAYPKRSIFSSPALRVAAAVLVTVGLAIAVSQRNSISLTSPPPNIAVSSPSPNITAPSPAPNFDAPSPAPNFDRKSPAPNNTAPSPAGPNVLNLCSINLDLGPNEAANIDDGPMDCIRVAVQALEHHPDASLLLVAGALTGKEQDSRKAGQRAAKVKNYLVQQKRIRPSRISTFSVYGREGHVDVFLVPPGATPDYRGLTPYDGPAKDKPVP